MAKFAPGTGKSLAVVDDIGIHFVDMDTGHETVQIVRGGDDISAIEFSPRDTYLVTCEKHQKN